MRGLGSWVYVGLTTLVCTTACGRLEFPYMPTPDADVDASVDASMDARLDTLADTGLDAEPDTVSPPIDATVDTGEPSDVGPDGSYPPGVIDVETFRSEWTTGSNIYWSWTLTGDTSALEYVEIVVGPNASAVGARSPRTTLFGPARNPELGFLNLPGAGDLVDHTITEGHGPDRTVFAQLSVYDNMGGRSVSDVISTTTVTAANQIVLFSDSDTAGYSLPSTFQRTSSGAFGGTHCYGYDSSCGGPPSCWENLRRQDIRVDLAALPSADFEHAWYEFAIVVEGTDAAPSYWSDVRLGFTGGDYYAFNWLTIPASGSYRVVQIPLRVFSRVSGGSVPLDHATTTAGLLNEFWVGGLWSNGATVRFDEARIRW